MGILNSAVQVRGFSTAVACCVIFLACGGQQLTPASGATPANAASKSSGREGGAGTAVTGTVTPAQSESVAPSGAAVPETASSPGGGAASGSGTPPPAAQAAAPVVSTPGAIHGTVITKPPSAAKSAVVYLEDAPSGTPVNAKIANQQMAFSPYLSVISVGGEVVFSNADPFPHNVFSPDNEKWDIGQIAPHSARSKTFSKAGAYVMLCHLHPNMRAYLLVAPSTYFAKVDRDGNFAIKDVPPGTYKVTAWAPGMNTSTQTITVNGDAAANFELHR